MTVQGLILTAFLLVTTVANRRSYGKTLSQSITIPLPLRNIPRGGMQLFVKTLTGKVGSVKIGPLALFSWVTRFDQQRNIIPFEPFYYFYRLSLFLSRGID
jgi:hypothetical protein